MPTGTLLTGQSRFSGQLRCKKINDDAWHTLLAAGLDRNVVVYDSAATAGQFTKRLVSLMKVYAA